MISLFCNSSWPVRTVDSVTDINLTLSYTRPQFHTLCIRHEDSPGDPTQLLNMPTSIPALQQVFNSLRGSITKPRPLSTPFHPSSVLDVWVSPLLINHFLLGLLYQRTSVTMQRVLLFKFPIRGVFKKKAVVSVKTCKSRDWWKY